MEHTTHTEIIFADSDAEAKEKYLALDIKPDHDENPKVDVVKVTEEEDVELDQDFNLFGEVSVGPDVMEKIRTDAERAYVVYYLEKH
ncbi:MAG: hypothetical protein FH758_13185 [Firmicutes bacterium]|nr:hypothetical protein [Bacillota bacterium]